MNGSTASMAMTILSALLLAGSGCGKDTPAPAGDGPGSTAPSKSGVGDGTGPQGPGPGASEIPSNPACKDLSPVGHFVGDIAPTATLVDNLGRSVNLHDFCEHTLLILAGSSTCPTCNARAKLAARLMRDKFTDGRVKLLYLLSIEGSDEADPASWVPAQLKDAQAFHAKHQFGPNALTLVDGDNAGLNALWPNRERPMNSMVLAPGFRIVTKGPGMPDFETDLNTALTTRETVF